MIIVNNWFLCILLNTTYEVLQKCMNVKLNSYDVIKDVVGNFTSY